MNRRWNVSRTNPEFISYLSKAASISPVFAQVLISRGLKDIESINSFLDPSLNLLHDPYLLPDMERAVERIIAARDNNESVLVHGDYDADGITATTVILDVLEAAGITSHYHIPDRIREGYGLSELGIRKAAETGSSLIITVDCGISSAERIESAARSGIDVIVTDHHVPPGNIPRAIAVIDPHREDSGYPFRLMAGVGVAFKLAQAFIERLGLANQEEIGLRLLDMVAIGTIADSVPMTGENRILVKYGLNAINDPACRTGIKILKQVCGQDGILRAGALSYTLIPRINAAGRLSNAGEVVELFRTDDSSQAGNTARLLDEQNRLRQKIENEVLESAVSMIEAEDPGNVIVLASKDWHPGVIGIVASRLVDLFYKPAMLFAVQDSLAKGSARGVPGLHLVEAISECSELLLGFGGHKRAAGLRIESGSVGRFRKMIQDVVARRLSGQDVVPTLEIDAAVSLADISFSLVREIEALEPFGEANRAPLFGARNIKILHHSIVGNNHLKMRLLQEHVDIDTIGFNMGGKIEELAGSPHVDIAFSPAINEWNGSRNLQLTLKAMRPSADRGNLDS